jgi:hypothetical protein
MGNLRAAARIFISMIGYPCRASLVMVGCFLSTGLAVAQGDSPGLSAPAAVVPAAVDPAPEVPATPEDKRVFGVLPNYRTAEASVPFAPLTARQKMTIASKDSFDWPVFPTAAAFATLYQLENQNPSFGQGMSGYAKRLAGSLGDQTVGNMMTEGIVPSLLHQDPRYFRLGEGSFRSRTWYAVTRIFVTRTDSDHTTFNFSEWGGNAAAVALSNAWYPDTRDVSDNAQQLLIQCASDAFSQVLKEFWPDVKRHFMKKHETGAETAFVR